MGDNVDSFMQVLDGRIEKPHTTDNELLNSVLTIFFEGRDERLLGGTALLIAPNIAITVSHCVAQWQPNLNVVSAISGKVSKVTSITWSNSVVFQVGDPIDGYPDYKRSKCDETFVVLKLKKRLPGPYARLEVPAGLGQLIAVAARSTVARGHVDYATLKVVANECTLLAAIEDASLSYPRVSGGPAFVDDIRRDEHGERPTAIGLQVCACNDIPVDFPVPGTKRFAGIIPITEEIKGYADSLNPAIATAQRKKISESSVVSISSAPREFVLRRKSDDTFHVEKCLLEIDDLDYFHVKPFRLEARGTLNLLTAEGAVWITRVTGKDQLRMQIVLNVSGSEQGSTVDMTLDLVKCDNVGAWLEGEVNFKSYRVFVYLFRLKDKVVIFKRRKGRIHLEAYIYRGGHYDDRPQVSSHKAELGQCAAIRKNTELKLFRRISWMDNPDLEDLVQDDVGNGHEGYDPP